jgi:hypothetical protein
MPFLKRRVPPSDVLSDVSDPELREGLRRVFAEAQNLIDTGRVEAVVLAARRLACIYQVLIEAGERPLEGADVISDRSIDFSLSRDARGVLILDDSVVVGTTLDGLASQVRNRCPGAQLFVRCVVIDEGQKVDFLLDQVNIASITRRASSEVSRFSQDIVQTLYRHQVPFFSDFPISIRMHVKRDEWIRHLRRTDWLLADVTPPLIDDSGIQGLAHVPTEQARASLLTRLQPELAQLVDAAKVRCYTRVDDGGDLDVVLVPIALLAPATTDTVRKSLVAIFDLAASGECAWQDWTPVTQQRFLQYVASSCVLAHYLEAARFVDSDSFSELLAPVPCELFFGSLCKPMQSILGSVVQSFLETGPGSHPEPLQLASDQPNPSPLLMEGAVQERLFESRELLSGIGVPPRPDAGELTKIGLIFSHAIASVFGYVDRTLEAQQRVQIRAMSDHAEYDTWMETGPGRVLNHGLTLTELAAALVPEAVASDAWAKALVSFGLDIGNDLGIIVPVTRMDTQRDIVYRCYRLGETAFLAGAASLSELVSAASTDVLPPMFRLADADYPVKSVVGPLAEAIPWQRRSGGNTRNLEADLQTLRLALLEATPGDLAEGWQGTVTGLADGYLEVNVTPVPQGPPRLARLPLAWIGNAEKVDARPGRPIVWSIWERASAGGKTRTNRIRLLDVPAIDLERARLVGEQVARLLQDED